MNDYLNKYFYIMTPKEMEDADRCDSIYELLEMKIPHESALELIKEDSKHLSDDSLDDCIELAKESKSEIAPEALKILIDEKEDRKSRRQSESWLDDVFGGED